MRWILIALLLGSVTVLHACGLADVATVEPHVNITYENNTESLLCLNHGTAESPRSLLGDCSVRVEPMKETTWSRECFSSIEVSSAEVVLIEEIYRGRHLRKDGHMQRVDRCRRNSNNRQGW